MNGYIHICLLVISSSPRSLHSRVPEPLTSTSPWTRCVLSSLTSVKWFHGYPSFRGKNAQCPVLFLLFAPHCVPSPPLFSVTCITSLFGLYCLLQRQLTADFTLVFLSTSFLNSILHNRDKLILISLLWIFSLSRLHPQKIWDPWGYDFVSLIFLFFFYSLT